VTIWDMRQGGNQAKFTRCITMLILNMSSHLDNEKICPCIVIVIGRSAKVILVDEFGYEIQWDEKNSKYWHDLWKEKGGKDIGEDPTMFEM
jgi:hypothetical protein